MFFSENHFLLPHIHVVVDGKICKRLTGVDTRLMVATRLVGFDPQFGRPIIDLVKVDKVFVDLGTMPEGLKDLLPDWFYHSQEVNIIDSSDRPLAELLANFGVMSDVENESQS